MYCTDILHERPLHNLHNAAVLFISSGCKFICLKIMTLQRFYFSVDVTNYFHVKFSAYIMWGLEAELE